MATGGSCIGIKYDGGVLLGADTLLSYGSLAKWPNIPRIKVLGKSSAICACGDYADFQDVTKGLEEEIQADMITDDGISMTPSELFSTLHRTMYSKRCDFEPAMCQFVFIGEYKGQTLLGGVDDIGTKWTNDCIATGYGAHICIPVLRRRLELKQGGVLTRAEATAVMQDCLRLLFYRDARVVNKFQIADASNGRVLISEPFSVDTKWDFEGFSFEKTSIIS